MQNGRFCMLTKSELLGYKTWPNRYQLEKDYLQYAVLLEIFKRSKGGLVFKGGTALQKCYGLDRFSEDLDFTTDSADEIRRVEDGLQGIKQLYNATFKRTENEQSAYRTFHFASFMRAFADKRTYVLERYGSKSSALMSSLSSMNPKRFISAPLPIVFAYLLSFAISNSFLRFLKLSNT